MVLQQSPLTETFWSAASISKKNGPITLPAHKAYKTVSISGCYNMSRLGTIKRTYGCVLLALRVSRALKHSKVYRTN